jgi:hypothetical protein
VLAGHEALGSAGWAGLAAVAAAAAGVAAGEGLAALELAGGVLESEVSWNAQLAVAAAAAGGGGGSVGSSGMQLLQP